MATLGASAGRREFIILHKPMTEEVGHDIGATEIYYCKLHISATRT